MGKLYKWKITSLVILGLFLFVSCNGTKEQVVKIGVITDLSSNMAWLGTYIRDAAELAKEEINEEGGIKGYPLKIVYEDNQFDPGQAVKAANKLVDIDNVQAMFTLPSASGVIAINNSLKDKEVVQMSPGCWAEGCHTLDDSLFRISGPIDAHAKTMTKMAGDILDKKKWAVLWVNNDYGLSCSKVTEREAEKYGAEIVFMEPYEARTSDFRSMLTKIKAAKADVMLLYPFGEAGYFFKQAKEIDLGVQIVSGIGAENPDVMKVAGDAANGIIYIYYDLEKALSSDFARKFKERYDYKPEYWAVKTYDAFHVMAKAFRSCEDALDSSCLKPALENLDGYDGIYGRVEFDEYGDLAEESYIYKTIKNGKYVLYE